MRTKWELTWSSVVHRCSGCCSIIDIIYNITFLLTSSRSIQSYLLTQNNFGQNILWKNNFGQNNSCITNRPFWRRSSAPIQLRSSATEPLVLLGIEPWILIRMSVFIWRSYFSNDILSESYFVQKFFFQSYF